MTPTPTGQLFTTEAGNDLVLRRTFRAPIADVWASVTESDRTARWFGPWEGEPGPGRMIKIQLAFEGEAPWVDARIEACEPPNRLAVSTINEQGTWQLELLLSEEDDATQLRLVHHLESTEAVGEVGAGWEYYLDQLVAAREGTPLPDFADYYPSMKPYFQGLAGTIAPVTDSG
jgi:uncharacterized protein YndB with AHSA1/START domain